MAIVSGHEDFNARPRGGSTLPVMKACTTSMRISDLLALRQEIGDLGGKHQRAAVVALDEFHDDFSCLLRLILLEEVTCGREN